MQEALTYEPEIWRREAACERLGVPTGVFFSDDIGDIVEAKNICAECPVLESCLEGVVASHGACGVASCFATATSWPISADEVDLPRSPVQRNNCPLFLSRRVSNKNFSRPDPSAQPPIGNGPPERLTTDRGDASASPGPCGYQPAHTGPVPSSTCSAPLPVRRSWA